MNKTAINSFAVWARKKLINDITYKASLLGINEKEILNPLPISSNNIQFFDIGTGNPTEIGENEIKQRNDLIAHIKEKESTSDYKTAYDFIIEEVAYTWFNRLIAIRFMEVNDYLPSRVRVLSSENQGKAEPDIVTKPFDADFGYSAFEKDHILRLKDENRLDELFKLLFIKQCNKLNEVLPGLFERTEDYSELLLNISFTDQDGIVNHLVNDIDEEDFTEAVEIIGWLYQYYNEDRKNEVINIYKGIVEKEDIPAATQLFTTDWVVRYMVDNSLGRYWLERNPESCLRDKLEYFISPKGGEIEYINEKITPNDLTFFDPCMGSGHILVYAFDVLIEIYREVGYLDRDAAREIVENNIFGLDIDDRAYQLSYFAVMMKARSYDRRFLTREITPKVYPIYDYTDITNSTNNELQYLINEFRNVKQYGSLVNLKSDLDLDNIRNYIDNIHGQLTLDTINITKIENIILVAELLLNKYTVVCTNPPYLNKYNATLKEYVTKHYKDYSKDLFSVFMYKNFEFCKKDGYSAFMTPFVWMFIKTYENLRKYIIKNKSITTLIQMEYSAFEEATVPICTFVLKNGKEQKGGIYIRLSEFRGGMEVQKQKVLEGLKQIPNCDYIYEVGEDTFTKIDGYPISYWVSEKLLNVFQYANPLKKVAEPKVGLQTGDNDSFLRLWYEVKYQKIGFGMTSVEDANDSGMKWFPYNKGGVFRRWFGNRDYIVNWENDGYEIKNCKNDQGKVRSRPQNRQFYFRSAITWSDITSSSFSGRYCEPGFMFDVKGSSGFPDEDKMFYILGFLNSTISQNCIKILNPTITTQVGDMARIPVMIDENVKIQVDELVKNNISVSKDDWDSFENSWEFKEHPFVSSKSLKSGYSKWSNDCNERFNQLKMNEEILNRIFIDIYGLGSEMDEIIDSKTITLSISDLKREIKSFISYAVGCMFGRYSLDQDGLVYAGGVWDTNCYSSFIPVKDNCILITDEEYFENDMLNLFVEFVDIVYGKDTLNENLDFIAKALGNKGNSSREVIRNYFVKDFYKDHCNLYSLKKAGKRPIYWMYDSGNLHGFKVLVYMHRYDEDTSGTVRVDYLHKMQKIYSSEIERMKDMIDNSTIAKDVSQAEKRKEKLIKQEQETKQYDEKIAHIALSRIDIDLDDGVKVNYEKVQIGQDGKKLEILAKV